MGHGEIKALPARASTNRVVYVLDSHYRINDRVRKIASLGGEVGKLVLVKPGNRNEKYQEQQATVRDGKREVVVVRPFVNPRIALEKLGMRSLGRILNRRVFFPSAQIFFIYAATRLLRTKISHDLRNGTDVILLTCVPAHDTVLAGLVLKKEFPRIKWMIDWQDLWSYDENYFAKIPGYYKQKALILERNALEKCDLNITTNKYAREVLIKNYGVNQNKVTYINHHFDQYGHHDKSADTAENKFNLRDSKVKIGFLGSFFKPPRVPGDKILRALQAARSNGIDAELHLYGEDDKSERAVGITGVIKHGVLPHEESVKEAAKCDVLLLMLADLPNCRAVMSIKLPHYLIMKKPIIAIVPVPSAIEEIINETGSGYVIPSSSDWSEELARVLKEYIVPKVKLHRDEEAVAEYSWGHTKNEWLTVLS